MKLSRNEDGFALPSVGVEALFGAIGAYRYSWKPQKLGDSLQCNEGKSCLLGFLTMISDLNLLFFTSNATNKHNR